MLGNKGISDVVVAGLIAIVALPAEAQNLKKQIDPRALPNPIFPSNPDYARGVAINRVYLERLVDLRDRYLSEGDTLSPSKKAAAQAELDRINADWRRQISNIDPSSCGLCYRDKH